METQQFQLERQLRENARNLLTSVSRLVEKAEQTFNLTERRELYLTAMSRAQEAYLLLERAKKVSAKIS